MEQKPASPLWVHDFAACLGLLTRLPVRVDSDLAMQRSAAATWAYPVVGVLIGTLGLCIFLVGQFLGLPPVVSLVLVFGAQIILTGAMHEDGLADSADGLWGGWSVERRLSIMKDSHIGVYGVCAIAVVLALKLFAAATLTLPLLMLALLGGNALSRAVLVAHLYSLPSARGGGLGQSVGRPPKQSVWIALGLAVGLTLVLGLFAGQLWAAVAMIIAAGLAAWACARIARAKIKGYTGDTLGATQQVCDVAILITLSAFVA